MNKISKIIHISSVILFALNSLCCLFLLVMFCLSLFHLVLLGLLELIVVISIVSLDVCFAVFICVLFLLGKQKNNITKF